MGSGQFDEVVKAATGSATKPAALRIVAGGILGGLLGLSGPVQARVRRRRCPPGTTRCNGRCVGPDRLCNGTCCPAGGACCVAGSGHHQCFPSVCKKHAEPSPEDECCYSWEGCAAVPGGTGKACCPREQVCKDARGDKICCEGACCGDRCVLSCNSADDCCAGVQCLVSQGGSDYVCCSPDRACGNVCCNRHFSCSGSGECVPEGPLARYRRG